jgi:hypothetical protein
LWSKNRTRWGAIFFCGGVRVCCHKSRFKY